MGLLIMTGNEHFNPGDYFRSLSSRDFLNFGMQQFAYVRPVYIEDQTAWAIHAADGTPLSVLDSEETALELIKHNELEPITVQ